MDRRMSSRIESLQKCATDYPEQRANIEAIIRYYEAGGRLPKAGVEVLYCFDGENVKVGSHEDLTHEHVARKAVGWVDVCCLTNSCAFQLFFPQKANHNGV